MAQGTQMLVVQILCRDHSACGWCLKLGIPPNISSKPRDWPKSLGWVAPAVGLEWGSKNGYQTVWGGSIRKPSSLVRLDFDLQPVYICCRSSRVTSVLTTEARKSGNWILNQQKTPNNLELNHCSSGFHKQLFLCVIVPQRRMRIRRPACLLKISEDGLFFDMCQWYIILRCVDNDVCCVCVW